MNSPQRFKEWIEVSLSLQHPNILNFVGHVMIDDVVYSVCISSTAVAVTMLHGSL